MIVHEFENTAFSWKELIADCKMFGTSIESRIGKTLELTNFVSTFRDPTYRYINPFGRNFNLPFALADFVDVMAGLNPGYSIYFNSKMKQFMNNDGRYPGSYAQRMVNSQTYNQFKRVFEELSNNPLSRRGVIVMNNPVFEDYSSNDVACTLSLQYLIRDGKLCSITTMRSEDLFLGYCYDTFQFQLIQECMAACLSFPLGFYSHNIGSLHLYQSDFEKASNIGEYNADALVIKINELSYEGLKSNIYNLSRLLNHLVNAVDAYHLFPYVFAKDLDPYFMNIARVFVAEKFRKEKMYEQSDEVSSKITNEFVDYFQQKKIAREQKVESI